jgi:hypothetical protein
MEKRKLPKLMACLQSWTLLSDPFIFKLKRVKSSSKKSLSKKKISPLFLTFMQNKRKNCIKWKNWMLFRAF